MKRLQNGRIDQGRPVFVILLAAALTGTGATIEAQTDGCALFDWPLVIEREWLTASDLPSYESGSLLPAFPTAGFILELLPAQHVKFAVMPDARTQSGRGGTVLLPSPEKRGIYQITLSDDAWIDLVQGGARLASRAHTGRKDCLVLRKSVRFELGREPVTLQLSGASSSSMRVAIVKVSEE
jgi:hypothetical protein